MAKNPTCRNLVEVEMSEAMFDFLPFKKTHFPTYKTWFEDEGIRTALGDVDEEWLDFVLNDEGGKEVAVLMEDSLMAIIGIAYPTHTYGRFTITNFAINPDFQDQGLGSQILRQFLLLPEFEGRSWVAYVDKANIAAQAFFSSNHWLEKEIDKEGMIKYELPASG